MRNVVLFLMGCWAIGSVCAQGLPKGLSAHLRQSGLPSSAVSFFVAETQPGATPRLAFQDDVSMNPASVMKLVTTFAALDLLGPNHTWKTRFLTKGPLEAGVLKGVLVIQGGGDPKWVVERIADDLAALKAKGLRTVQGDLILDRSIFSLPPLSPAAFDGEGARLYNVTPDGLLVNFKAPVVTVSAEPGATGVQVVVSPPVTDLVVQNQATLVPEDGCDERRHKVVLEYKDTNTLLVTGSFQLGCSPKKWSAAFGDPDQFAPRVLKAMLTEAGITMTGNVYFGTTPVGSKLLHEGQSLPLHQIIADINKFSNNVMARQVFLTLGTLKSQPSSLPVAQEVVLNWWQQRFPPVLGIPVFENGSGLSRHERITTAALGALLEKAYQHRYAADFVASLGRLGIDDTGTAKRMAERETLAPLLGRAALKTGTLNDVRAVAGYVQGDSGKTYRVAAIVNHPQVAGKGGPLLDAFLRWVVDDKAERPPTAKNR